jgi:hypothetical protein
MSYFCKKNLILKKKYFYERTTDNGQQTTEFVQ